MKVENIQMDRFFTFITQEIGIYFLCQRCILLHFALIKKEVGTA